MSYKSLPEQLTSWIYDKKSKKKNKKTKPSPWAKKHPGLRKLKITIEDYNNLYGENKQT